MTCQMAYVTVQAVNHSSIVVDQEKASNKKSDLKGPLEEWTSGVINRLGSGWECFILDENQ